MRAMLGLVLALVTAAAATLPGPAVAAAPFSCEILGYDRVPQGDSAPNRPTQILAEWTSTGLADLDCPAGIIALDVWEHAIVAFPTAALDGGTHRLTGRTELAFMMSIEDVFSFRGRISGSVTCDSQTHLCDIDLTVRASGVNNNGRVELHETGVLNGDTEQLVSIEIVSGFLVRAFNL